MRLRQADDYVLPSEPPSPPWKTPKCLELPFDGQTVGNTPSRLGRGKESWSDRERGREAGRGEVVLIYSVCSPAQEQRHDKGSNDSQPTDSYLRAYENKGEACNELKGQQWITTPPPDVLAFYATAWSRARDDCSIWEFRKTMLLWNWVGCTYWIAANCHYLNRTAQVWASCACTEINLMSSCLSSLTSIV